MSEEMDAYLAALDTTHKPEGVPDTGSNVPDGKYQTKLDSLYFAQAKSSGRNQCIFEFEIINGEHAFRKILKFAGMDTAEKLDYLTRDFRRLGIETFKWSSVQQQFKNVLDKLFEIEVKTTKNAKGEFTNIFIQKQLKSDEVMLSKTIAGANSAIKKDVPF